jgi:hypothetical protein
MFRKAFIDVYLLGISNLKGCVHSQPQKHFYLKQYKESPRFSLCLFIFTYFFILIGVMNESALERQKSKREGGWERSWSFRKEQIEKESETSLINLNDLCKIACFMCTYNRRDLSFGARIEEGVGRGIWNSA